MTRALLLIDVQKVYTSPESPLFVEGHEMGIANMNRLIEAFSAAEGTIIYIRHQHKEDGSDQGRMFDFLGAQGPIGFVAGTPDVEVDTALKVPSSALHIVKQRYSSFVGTGLDGMLKGRGIDNIVVTGFMTNYCCETTARHAHDLDYFVDFIVDATGCPDLSTDVTQEKIKSVVEASLQGGIARVHSTDQFIKDFSQSCLIS